MIFAVLVALWNYGCSYDNTCGAGTGGESANNEPLWLAKVKNNTGLPLLLPATNPLRSLAEMAGKISSDYRQSVMDLLRDDLRQELEQKGFRLTFPRKRMRAFRLFPPDSGNAVRLAREGKLSGLIFVSEISRWEGGFTTVRSSLR